MKDITALKLQTYFWQFDSISPYYQQCTVNETTILSKLIQYAYIHTHARTHARTYIHTYVHTYICTHLRTYIEDMRQICYLGLRGVILRFCCCSFLYLFTSFCGSSSAISRASLIGASVSYVLLCVIYIERVNSHQNLIPHRKKNFIVVYIAPKVYQSNQWKFIGKILLTITSL